MARRGWGGAVSIAAGGKADDFTFDPPPRAASVFLDPENVKNLKLPLSLLPCNSFKIFYSCMKLHLLLTLP
jgi:hypothetical protein